MLSALTERKTVSIQLVAVLALVGVNALWGLSFPIMKSLNLQMEQFFGLESPAVSNSQRVAFSSGMIGLRFLVSLAILSIACPILVRRATAAEWRAGILVGLLFYVGLVLQVIGLATIPASRSGFLTSLTAVFTPIFSSIVFRKPITANVILGVAIALLGVSILTGLIVLNTNGICIAPDAVSKWTFGDTLTTLGAVLFTGQLLLVDYYGTRVNTTAITPGMFLTVSVAAGITFMLLHSIALQSVPAHSEAPWSSWAMLYFSQNFIWIILFLAIFCSVVAFVGMNKYQPHISAVQASVVYSTEPLFASLWALFLPSLLGRLDPKMGYPNETVSLPLILGGAFVLLANVVTLWPRAKMEQQRK
jgi:drug/metabolite transporter (DMT)-like permease